MIIKFNPFLVTNLGKSLSSKVVSKKFTIFGNSIFIQWRYILCSKQFKVMDDSLSFFWWNVKFLLLSLFSPFLLVGSNFISYFISNQISCLKAVFAVFCPVFVAVSINFSTIFITEFSCKWQKARSFNAYSKSWFCWISHFYDVWPIISIK